MAARPGRKRKHESELRGTNDARQELVFNSKYSNRVVKSQKTCTVRENRRKLEKLLEQSSVDTNVRVQKTNRIKGLLSVWDMLTADAVGKDGKEHTSCFVAFDDALEMYYDSQEEIIKRPPYINTDKDQFMCALLHEELGTMCVHFNS